MRRHIATVGCLAVIGFLTGCVYDAARPQVTYENRLAEDVLVTVEGANMPYQVAVGSNSSNSLGTDECKGTAIVVKTEDGDLVGRVEEPACPDWRLVVNEDGTLDYTE